ncbi:MULTISPECIES: hypothetical protein [Emticicia]|uniref:hypothetical protein n=1 Tax=Emticicia TaxID=312278 RepID=UPI000C785026|nr:MULTISPECIES: hypothetical protein [Emticicia]PLK44229.1 hypothetical protein C0V77_10535 [Emticicia sp. TH156]UTA66854.1 hypothetical protein MB380_14710 [Emticicia sp. 21SJ11W-3]
MKNLLHNLNFVAFLACPVVVDELSRTKLSIYNFITGEMFFILYFVWGVYTLNTLFARVPFFESIKVRIITIASLMSFALIVGLLVIHNVG